MKANELRELSKTELESKITDIKKNMFNLKFQKASGQLDSPMKIKNFKKDIAKIETVLREQELGLSIAVKPVKAVKSVKRAAVKEPKVKKEKVQKIKEKTED